jgi:trk system potassium uptake protein TrkH
VPNINPEKPLTPGQLRRQQQREANLLRASAPAPMPVVPIKPASELLGPSVLVPAFCAIIVLGYLLYHVSGFAVPVGNELSQSQSIFTAVNAATLTGFQQSRNPDNYTNAGKSLTLMLMLGGMVFSFIGGGVAVIRIARLRFTDWDLFLWTMGSIGCAGILGGLAMSGQGRTAQAAVFDALSAFGNSGLILGTLPDPGNFRSLLVLLPLAAVGGLGLPVLMDLYDFLTGRGRLSRHSRVVLTWSAGIYLACAVLLLAVQWPGSNGHFPVWRSTIADSSNLAINARTAGLPFDAISDLPQAATFLLILMMVIGASPGGTGGGLKVTTLSLLSRGTLDTIQGEPAGRRFGTALIWLSVYVGMLVVSTLGLLITEPDMHLDRTLFLAASALGNVGLSHNPVSASNPGLYVLSATMILGRVAPMMMLWYVLDTTPDTQVAVG